MLFNLKKNVSNSFKLKPSIFGGLTVNFDPLTLPNYQAGYFMNTTATPPGSIDPALVSGQWFDGLILSNASKYLQTPAGTVLANLNGFNGLTISALSDRVNNVLFDVFTNAFLDFTILLGFRKTAAIVNFNMLFAQNNSANDERCYLAFTPALKVEAQIANTIGANAITCTSAGNFNDQLAHAFVAVYDQTNKKVRLITHTGENLNNTNAAYVSKNLQGNSFGDFRLGDWNFAPPLFAYPGIFGDVIILNTAVNDPIINQLLAWECNRIGCIHVPI